MITPILLDGTATAKTIRAEVAAANTSGAAILAFGPVRVE